MARKEYSRTLNNTQRLDLRSRLVSIYFTKPSTFLGFFRIKSFFY